MKPLVQKARVLENRRAGDDYVILETEVEKSLECMPGQFAMLHGDWSCDPLWSRAFSLLTGGSKPSFLIKTVGRGTRRLAAMNPGEEITMTAPLGNGFSIPGNDLMPVLVAGGTGAAPLCFLAEILFSQGRREQTRFLYGGRSCSDLPLRDRVPGGLNLVCTTDDASEGEGGPVTLPLERVLNDSPASKVFACGPVPMLAETAKIASSHGVSCEISFETVMACGIGLCMGCAVPSPEGGYIHLCHEGPVIDAQKLDWDRL